MNVFCIGTESVVRGFALIGIEGVSPAGDDVAPVVRSALERPDTGLLLITEGLAAAVGDELTEWALTRKQPLVLEIPDETGPMAERTTVLSLVKEALGLGSGDE